MPSEAHTPRIPLYAMVVVAAAWSLLLIQIATAIALTIAFIPMAPVAMIVVPMVISAAHQWAREQAR